MMGVIGAAHRELQTPRVAGTAFAAFGGRGRDVVVTGKVPEIVLLHTRASVGDDWAVVARACGKLFPSPLCSVILFTPGAAAREA